MHGIIAFFISLCVYAFWGLLIYHAIKIGALIAHMLVTAVTVEVIKGCWPEKLADIQNGNDPPRWLYILVLFAALTVIAVFFVKGWEPALITAGGFMFGGAFLSLGICAGILVWRGALSTAQGVIAGDSKAYRNAAIWLVYLGTIAGYWVVRGVWSAVSIAVLLPIAGGTCLLVWKFALGVVADAKRLISRA